MNTITSPEEIKVGKYYYSPFIGCLCLGCGMRKINTANEFENKQLVVLINGRFIQQGENAMEGLWENGFDEVPKDYVPDTFIL
jgi:hypothetical protein